MCNDDAGELVAGGQGRTAADVGIAAGGFGVALLLGLWMAIGWSVLSLSGCVARTPALSERAQQAEVRNIFSGN